MVQPNRDKSLDSSTRVKVESDIQKILLAYSKKIKPCDGQRVPGLRDGSDLGLAMTLQV